MYTPNPERYQKMPYRHCGKSGLRLPAISLGMWQNFSYSDNLVNMENMVRTAFDLGITHFDLANNYGHPYNGSAEENLKKILDRGMRAYRDQLCIATKAGYEMWEGPYGDRNGSKKYLVASLDQSLKRMGLDYVDIFYHHVFDPDTALEETALALDGIVKSGKALYVGISNYNSEQTKQISKIFTELKTPFIVNQCSYSMINRWIENDCLDQCALQDGFGLAVFSPLSQGVLTDRYLKGIPSDSRIGKGATYIADSLTERRIMTLNNLNAVAAERGQTLAQLALSWVLSNPAVSTVLIGASRPSQIEDDVCAAYRLDFTKEEKEKIEKILAEDTAQQ